jgi:hypothetical protein
LIDHDAVVGVKGQKITVDETFVVLSQIDKVFVKIQNRVGIVFL